MKRSLLTMTFAICALTFCSLGSAHAGRDQSACQIPVSTVYGLIGNWWRQMGETNSKLGCPSTNDEVDGPKGGRIRQFVNGQIAWTPSTGPQSMQAVWRDGPNIVVAWQDTSPFNYDFFIVRWDKDGGHDEGDGQVNVQGETRTRGSFVYRNADPAINYTFYIEGCDDLGNSTCRQGWSNPVSTWATKGQTPRIWLTRWVEEPKCDGNICTTTNDVPRVKVNGEGFTRGSEVLITVSVHGSHRASESYQVAAEYHRGYGRGSFGKNIGILDCTGSQGSTTIMDIAAFDRTTGFWSNVTSVRTCQTL